MKHSKKEQASAAEAPSGKGEVAGKEQRVEATAAAFSEQDAAQSQVMLALGALLSTEPSACVQVRHPKQTWLLT